MKIELRTWSREDLDVLVRANTPDMTTFLGGPETDAQLEERHQRYLLASEAGTARMYRIDVDGRSAGTIGGWHVDHDDTPAWEVGWSVFPEWQGRGIARRALRLLLRDLVAEGSRSLVTAFPGVDNASSNALCRGAGFESQGTMTEPWRGGELTCRIWTLDISPLAVDGRAPDGDDVERLRTYATDPALDATTSSTASP